MSDPATGAVIFRRALGALRARATQWWRPASGSTTSLRDIEFVAIDLETTGLDPRTDVPVALAAIPFRGGRPQPESGYTRLVNPGRPIPITSTAVHGIRDTDVREAPPVSEALRGFLETCGDQLLVAHTAGFDLAIVSRLARAAGLPVPKAPVLDIGAVAHALFPSWWDLSLEGLGRLVEVEPIDRHTAPGDALTAGLILVRLIPLLERRGASTVAGALRLQRRGPITPGGPGAHGGGLVGP